jgi:uncharacterized damage-inducible protein DinB
MSLNKPLLSEFDHETAGLRKTLERIPDKLLDWQPHKKSFSFRGLATHLANLPSWTVYTIRDTELNVAPKDGKPYREEAVTSVADALKRFDANVKAAREAIAGASDEDLRVPWSLLSGEHTVFTLPRIAVLRSMILNHLIHHRAQLTVYLRLNDLPVPALYGPSADEQ